MTTYQALTHFTEPEVGISHKIFRREGYLIPENGAESGASDEMGQYQSVCSHKILSQSLTMHTWRRAQNYYLTGQPCLAAL